MAVFTFTFSNLWKTAADVTLLLTWEDCKWIALYNFAVAAEESEDVHFSEYPCFVISENSHGITAREMWQEIKEFAGSIKN
ncbi:uncharacterized protein [Henckelia pumila]|uniref:uncharacterized protein isoform X5 n=1 Tax=Henckelia pumila TaxID=405737 RepID=UPI003C6E970A